MNNSSQSKIISKSNFRLYKFLKYNLILIVIERKTLIESKIFAISFRITPFIIGVILKIRKLGFRFLLEEVHDLQD